MRNLFDVETKHFKDKTDDFIKKIQKFEAFDKKNSDCVKEYLICFLDITQTFCKPVTRVKGNTY